MNANIIKVEGSNGIVNLYTDDTLTLAICEDVDSETGEPTNLFESTPKDLLAALGREACEKLASETRDSNERSKLERALELA